MKTQKSFVVLAVHCAGKFGSTYSIRLQHYISNASIQGMFINDIHDDQIALEWAAYHRGVGIVLMLLESNYPLANPSTKTHPINWKKNGRLEVLKVIFNICKKECTGSSIEWYLPEWLHKFEFFQSI